MRLVQFFLMSLLVLAGCQMNSEYQEWVDKELASGVREDSIFLGMTFGMTSDSFYDHCWDMNKKGFFKNGPTNSNVEFDISDQLKHPGKMYFYPTFYQGKIYEMPVAFSYDAFAWADDYSIDTLFNDVKDMMEYWYGPFKEFKHPSKGSVFVNIKGNRRIRLFKNNLKESVNAVFTDLSLNVKEGEEDQPEKDDKTQ